MATDDQQRLVVGTASAPATFTVPGNGQMRPKAIFAHYDGSGAAASFLPALKVTSDAGKTVGIYPVSTAIVAGASAEVSWAPFLRVQALANGSGIPPFAALDDYVFKHTNTTVTGVGFASQANLIIQGNPISLDGATRIKVEFFAPVSEVTDGVPNQALGYSLWDGATNRGVIAYVEAGNAAKANAGLGQAFGGPTYGVIIDTPSAGTHTYAIYAFRNQPGGDTLTVFGSTFVDGTGNLGPCWYRVTTT